MQSFWWFVGAMVLGIAEVFTLDLTFAMLAGGALAAGGVALLGAPWWAPIITFVVVSTALFFIVRPPMLAAMRRRSPAMDTNMAAMVGRQGVALDDVTESSGRAKVYGEVWTARTRSGTIPEGAHVAVVAIEGATAIVAPLEV